MRTLVIFMLLGLALAALLFLAVYVGRTVNNAASPVNLHTPKPGVTCAVLVSNGSAISCWKD